MAKKRICLVTDWYPTKENPYQGGFFKEQAFAVEGKFDFLILRFVETAQKKPGKKLAVSMINKERNTIEYRVHVKVPISIYIMDAFEDFKRKRLNHETIEGVGKYVSRKRLKFMRNYYEKALKLVNEKFDILYCVDAQSEAARLKMLSDITGKPYIVGEHAPFPWPGTTIQDYQKTAIESANGVLAISNDKIRQMLLQNVKLPPVTYIGNLVDESQFKLNDENKNKEKTFIIVAANSFYKNYDMFISVMDRLTEITDVPFRVMVVGYSANKGYSKNVELLERELKSSKFAERLELIPEVMHSEIGVVYNKADVFVMTSIQEGQPVSALEAACCGLPIFSTRCGGVEDYVTDEIGRIYSVSDVEGFAVGLKDYLEGVICFEPKKIRNTVINKFGKEAFIKNFVEVFDEVI